MNKSHVYSAPLITFLLALGVYLLTIAPDLTWAHWGVDSGELIAAATTLGVPHPPGYPTYTILAHLFSFLPVGSIPFRFNLFSAVNMAFAAAMVTAISQSAYQPVSQSTTQHSELSTQYSVLNPHPSLFSTPLFTGLTFAFAPLVWSQAIITEVYALNLACLALFLWLLLRERPAFTVGLALGLSLTTHLSSGLMIPLALWMVRRGRIPHLLSGFLLGLTPYLLLPLFAQNPTPVVWGDPSTLSGWLWLISGRLFASNVFALPPSQWPARLWELGWVPFIQFTPAGLPLLLYGLYTSWQKRGECSGKKKVEDAHCLAQPARGRAHSSFLNLTKDEATGIPLSSSDPAPLHSTHHALCITDYAPRTTLALLLTTLAYFLYAFTYTSADALVFLTPALLGLSILLTFGLRHLGRWGFVLPLTLVTLNFGAINLRQEMGPRPQAEQLLQGIPPNALVLTPGDETLFTLWALQQGEGQRSDLILVDINLFAFGWYRQRLARLYPHLTALAEDDVTRFRQANQVRQPVCEVTIHQPKAVVCYGINP